MRDPPKPAVPLVTSGVEYGNFMHLHAYSVPGVRVVPPRHERGEWETDEVISETTSAVQWLSTALRELCGKPDMDLTDETQVWIAALNTGESVHTGAKGTALLMESWPDCQCEQDRDVRIAPLRRGRRR